MDFTWYWIELCQLLHQYCGHRLHHHLHLHQHQEDHHQPEHLLLLHCLPHQGPSRPTHIPELPPKFEHHIITLSHITYHPYIILYPSYCGPSARITWHHQWWFITFQRQLFFFFDRNKSSQFNIILRPACICSAECRLQSVFRICVFIFVCCLLFFCVFFFFSF